MTFTSKTGKTISLRTPTEGDEKILFDYAKTLEAEDTFVLLNPSLPITWTEEVDYLAASIKKIRASWQVHYLAFYNDQMIGSTQISILGRRKMHVGSFGISLLPSFRNDGIGIQLANFIIDQAKTQLHITMITLEVFAKNLIAQKLYSRLGFKEYGRLPGGLNYRDSYQDSILMYKTL